MELASGSLKSAGSLAGATWPGVASEPVGAIVGLAVEGLQMASLCPMWSYLRRLGGRPGVVSVPWSAAGAGAGSPTLGLHSSLWLMLGVAPQTKPRVGVGPGKWELIGAITVPLPGHGTCANGHSVSLGSEPALGSQHALLEWRRPELAAQAQSFQSRVYRPWLPCSTSRFGAPFSLLFFEALNCQSRKPLTLPQ